MNRIGMMAVIGSLAAASLVGTPAAGARPRPPTPPSWTSSPPTSLTTGIEGASGSTIGPDGALYVTESDTGQLLRVDRRTGTTTVFATGLPKRVAPIGGPMDLTFRHGTAYVLVSLVGAFFGTDDATGIYRMDGPDQFTLLADLGTWATENPPGSDFDWFIETGVHFAIENYRRGFVVTDAHHNRLLYVSEDGDIESLSTLGNVVPAGLDVHGSKILMAWTGPTPHLPEDGQIVSYDRRKGLRPVASGGPLMIDVERGRGGTIFGLAQGYFTPGQDAGAPAEPNTGQLLAVGRHGDVEVVVDNLDRPTSMEIVGDTAYVVGLGGDIVRIDDISRQSRSRR